MNKTDLMKWQMDGSQAVAVWERSTSYGFRYPMQQSMRCHIKNQTVHQRTHRPIS